MTRSAVGLPCHAPPPRAGTRRSWLAGLGRRNTCDRDGVATIGARRIYILPTAIGTAFGAVLFATLLGSLNYQNNLGLFLTFLMAGIALVSMHHCWYNLLGLSLRAADAEAVFCGQPARFGVELRGRRGRAHGELCIRDGGCTALAAGRHGRLEIERPTTHRGPLALGELVIETEHPLGLFRAWAWVRTNAEVLVFPRPAPTAPPAQTAAADGRETTGRSGPGADDFIGPRAYRPGDSPRQLDWKALARERGLVTKQFGGHQAARVWIDLERVAGGLEERLSLLTRQVLDADAQQLEYGLRLGAAGSIECGRGETQRLRCLEALARVAAEPRSDASERATRAPAA